MRVPVAVGVALLSILAGCSSPEGTTPPMDAEGRYVIEAGNSTSWSISAAKIPVGSTMVWRNNGTILHDVSGYVGDPIKEDQPDFHTGYGEYLDPGEAFTHKFDEKGTWTIWCHTHHEQGMKQLVHVV